jgi:DNA helicase-2/ATP-dependent DNA helicase PcrA
MLTPSKYQLQIINHAINRPGQHALVQACAGAGKTSTLLMLCNEIRDNCHGKSILCVAFNKEIAETLQRKMPPGVVCSTLHSHGLRAIRNAEPKVRVEQRKGDDACWQALNKAGRQGEEARTILGDLKRLVPLAMGALLEDGDDAGLMQVVERTGASLELPAQSLPLVWEVVGIMREVRNFINFDEMIYHPIAHNYKLGQFDYVLVDETQDLNRAQQELVARSLKPGGTIIAVGDFWQSIYGFRGADPQAMQEMKERHSMTEYRLPVSYRCPKAIVARAQAIAGPDIITEYEGAVDGEIISRKFQDLETTIQGMKAGDMGLCRVNAPLMRFALSLIRVGRKAVIRGRDIGRELANLVRRLNAQDVADLQAKLQKWADKESRRMTLEGKDPTPIQDKAETIGAVVESCETDDVCEVTAKLESIFTDDCQGVVFSSVHRAKGLEARTVVIFAPELMPHPMAVKHGGEVALQQERNLEYVAVTRSQETLILQPLPTKR